MPARESQRAILVSAGIAYAALAIRIVRESGIDALVWWTGGAAVAGGAGYLGLRRVVIYEMSKGLESQRGVEVALRADDVPASWVAPLLAALPRRLRGMGSLTVTLRVTRRRLSFHKKASAVFAPATFHQEIRLDDIAVIGSGAALGATWVELHLRDGSEVDLHVPGSDIAANLAADIRHLCTARRVD